ncbi:unnamed protein product [Brassica rapa subsp. trilocularis]
MRKKEPDGEAPEEMWMRDTCHVRHVTLRFRDGGRDTRRSGSIIASGVARHSSDSSPDTKLVDKTVEGVDIISCMPHEIIHYMFGASQWKVLISSAVCCMEACLVPHTLSRL